MDEIKHIIEKLDLKPHPEGGYFRETYRSAGEILPVCLGPDYNGKRNYATCIYYFLATGPHWNNSQFRFLNLLTKRGCQIVAPKKADIFIGQRLF